MNKEKFTQAVIFIFFIVLCSIPLFFNLGKLCTQLWDESRNGINALEMLHDHSFIVTHFDGAPDMWNTKPPFFIWMVALCMKMFGATAFSLRLPSALAAFAIAVYSFWFSKKYLGNILTGFISGFVLVTSLGFIDFHVARNGDFDAMLSMWIFFYCTQFFMYLETRQRKHLVAAGIFVGFAILTKGIAGCMFLPGLFIVALFSSKYRTVFKKSELYVLTFLGILMGLSYYFLREIYNPGYIKAVIENEITGRYLEVNEGHPGDAWYYLRLAYDYHFSAWLYWLPVAIIVIPFLCKGRNKSLGIFLFIQVICFLIILSISKTKIQWYDAPFFPFLGLLLGLTISEFFGRIKKLSFLKNRWKQGSVFFILSMGICYMPVQAVWGSSVFRERQREDSSIFYGDFLANYFSFFPRQQSLKIISYGYNAHLLFYAKIYRYQGKTIDIIGENTEIHKQDTMVICNTNLWPKFNPAYVFDTLYQEGQSKFILTLADSTDLSDPRKIGEKQLFRYVGSINDSPEWLEDIGRKAKKAGIDTKKMAMRDALWMIADRKIITPEIQAYLKTKYNL